MAEEFVLKLWLCLKEFYIEAAVSCGFPIFEASNGYNNFFFLWWCSANFYVSIRILYFYLNLSSFSASVVSNLPCLSTIGVSVALQYLPLTSLATLYTCPCSPL